MKWMGQSSNDLEFWNHNRRALARDLPLNAVAGVRPTSRVRWFTCEFSMCSFCFKTSGRKAGNACRGVWGRGAVGGFG